jgi:transposase
VRTTDGGWRRTGPWETEFVDLATGQGVLGQVGGRSGASVKMWLAEQTAAFRDAICFVALDPPYVLAVHRVLPHATVVVDHFHLVPLANRAVTKVRQRVTQQQLGRRGRRTDPVWANRRMLSRARERLSERAFTRMWNGAVDNDPSGQLLAAWIATEEPRALLGCAARGGQRHDIAHRLTRFDDWCARVDIPEITTFAQPVETWWPETLAFLQTGITNAGTEGTNRLVKQVLRGACGFRNKNHYQMRVRSHCARQRASAGVMPAQS